MSTYEVTVTFTFTKTVSVSGKDVDGAGDELDRMINSGEVELDFNDDLTDYEFGCFELVSDDEEDWGCQMYHELRDEGI